MTLSCTRRGTDLILEKKFTKQWLGIGVNGVTVSGSVQEAAECVTWGYGLRVIVILLGG